MRQIIKNILILALVLFSFSSVTAAEKKSTSKNLAIAFEKHFDQRGHQTTLIFDRDRITLISNSNFLLEPGNEAVLGVQDTSSENEALKKVRLWIVKKAQAEMGKMTKPDPVIRPHDVRVSINGLPCKLTESEYEQVESDFIKAISATKWKGVDTILVSHNKFGENKVIYSGTDKKGRAPSAKCQENRGGKGTFCEYKGFGYAYFK